MFESLIGVNFRPDADKWNIPRLLSTLDASRKEGTPECCGVRRRYRCVQKFGNRAPSSLEGWFEADPGGWPADKLSQVPARSEFGDTAGA
ncbi:hypothetical protein T265_10036 [Opisthorchis viverrini]|uniref:Uncharacterized protein n=1 Tax=Opisthorchis viverrini TaxID=6198 RepID=A0A074ZEQ8_OPIVI|nr:hypothetical protein T265_10036 [Opisthorchis viverrini]KER21710.1 hypothetical protein T265_10036 [Opisthorchis viverrini]